MFGDILGELRNCLNKSVNEVDSVTDCGGNIGEVGAIFCASKLVLFLECQELNWGS